MSKPGNLAYLLTLLFVALFVGLCFFNVIIAGALLIIGVVTLLLGVFVYEDES